MTEPRKPFKLSIVIPSYNESNRINLLYNGLSDFFKKWSYPLEVIIVNDGSTDNTYQLLQEHDVYKANANLIQVFTQPNTGKGGALRLGVSKATGDFILTLDADMASPPSELLGWFDKLNWELDNNTIYIGSREHPDSEIIKQGERKVAGNIFNLIVRTLTPLSKIRDTQCGFKLYPAGWGHKFFDGLKTYGWAHDVELLYRAHLNKVKIIEMPLKWNAIEGSKIRLLRDGFNMVVETLRIVISTKA